MRRSLRQRRFVFFSLLLLLLSVAPSQREISQAGTRSEPQSAQRRRIASHVLVISLDGVRPDALQRATTPHIDSLWQRGSYSWKAQTILPSITLVAHASMVSGVEPKKHGIDWNETLPDKGEIKVQTMFDVAKQAGLTTAMIAGKTKFVHLSRKGTVDYFLFAGYTDEKVGEAAAQHILAAQPNLCLIHFPGPDSTGHVSGWMSEQQIKTIERCDREVGRILAALQTAGIARDTVILLTADHGGHERTHGTDSPEDVTIPFICWGKGVRKHHALQTTVKVYDTAATALYVLGLRAPADWDGKPVKEAFVKHL